MARWRITGDVDRSVPTLTDALVNYRAGTVAARALASMGPSASAALDALNERLASKKRSHASSGLDGVWEDELLRREMRRAITTITSADGG